MDSLPAEILLCIAECSTTLPELLEYRRISRRFKQAVDDKCKSHALYLLHRRPCPPAVDDALLAIRLKRIPWESCCHYDYAQGDYSFYPSKDFFDAVLDETEVPPGCPSIPAATWMEEIHAVMDLYLLVLAYLSTSMHCPTNNPWVYPGGTELLSIDKDYEWPKPQTEAIIRSYFRNFVFTTVYAPRVFVEPFAAVAAMIEDTPRLDYAVAEDRRHNIVSEEFAKYPVLESLRLPLEDRPRHHPVFDGFFEWLYAQCSPLEFLVLPDSFQDPAMGGHPSASLTRSFPGEERHQLALMQIWKIHQLREDRGWGSKPEDGYYVAARFNPIQPELTGSTIVYRRLLHVSVWSEPQIIINDWVQEDAYSLVLRDPGKEEYHFTENVLGLHRFNALGRILEAELKNRFGLRYKSEYAEYLDIDCGILDPRPELEQWV